MAQHDFIIDDTIPAAVRADINNAFLALATNNSGASAPTTTYPCMFWADTSAAQELKIRSVDNTTWITVGKLNQANMGRAIAGLGLTGTGPVFYNNTTGTFATVLGGEIQRSAPVVTTSPASYTGYTRFNDGSTSPIDNTQGATVFSTTFTPQVTTSTIRCDFNIQLGTPNLAFQGILALFSNLSSSPICMNWVFVNQADTIRGTYWHTGHNTTSTLTYTLKFGATTDHAGGIDFYINRGNTTPTLGNTTESWIALSETMEFSGF